MVLDMYIKDLEHRIDLSTTPTAELDYTIEVLLEALSMVLWQDKSLAVPLN